LYFKSRGSIFLSYQHEALDISSSPSEINIETSNFESDENTTLLANDNVERDFEGLHLATKELFEYDTFSLK